LGESEALKGRWGLLLLVIGVLLCTGVAQTSPGHAVLRSMGLFETPASYTELAFTNAASVEEAFLSKTKAPITVSFGIHNASGAGRSYQWSIESVFHNGKSQVNASGAVSVPAQGHATVSKKVTLSCPAGRDQVEVKLASPAESLNFWLSCPGGSLLPPGSPTASPTASPSKATASPSKGSAG
jgi:hypothetical protein